MTQLLSPGDVARRVGRSKKTVRGWIQSGNLRAINTGTPQNPRWCVDPADLERFLESRAGVPHGTSIQ